MRNYRGILVVVSGPSGSGKGTICSELNKRRKDDVTISISVTSRRPRTNDIEGENYYFKTEQEFERMIENDELLEWIRYCDNYYGTPKYSIDEKLDKGMNVVLEIEVNGALNIKKRYKDSVLIFVVPPKYEDLIERLRGRGTEAEAVIQKRINKAIVEIQSVESYDYLVVNDTIQNAVYQLESIIDAERSKVTRNQGKLKRFIETLKEVKINDRTVNQ